MATTGAVGGSSIDVQSLVSQLVAAERQPLDAQIARASSRVATQISAVGSLMGAMSTFQSALSSLRTTAAFNTRTTASSDTSIATASASTSAVPGRYDIEVDTLASAHQISSTGFDQGSTEVVGTGSLTLSLGSTSFSVNIDSTNYTVAGIRDAINAASDNPGIRATIINAADGAHLVLTSSKTGAANAISVSQAGGDGGLADLEYSASNQANYTQLREALDAHVIVAGNYDIYSATNVIDGVIEGVTLNLVSAEPGTTVSIDVTFDKTAATQRINTFVQAYNALRTQITRLGGYDAASQTAGPMLGDALLSGIDSELRRTLGTPVEAAGSLYQTLASIGIKTQADGTLKINETELQAALTNDFDAVSKLFGSTDGVAAKMYQQVSDRLADGSAIDSRNDSLAAEQKALAKRTDDVNTRMAIVQQQYLKQFTALDALLSQLQTTSSFLTQQIDSLPGFGQDS